MKENPEYAAIRKNMQEKSLEPDDGIVDVTTSWGAKFRYHSDSADHSWMDTIIDDDIEYSIDIFVLIDD